MSLTPDDMAAVLERIASFDGRTWPDEDAFRRAAAAWCDAVGDVVASREEALVVVDTWYRHNRERIMPADLRGGDIPECPTCGAAHHPGDPHPPFPEWPAHKALSSPFRQPGGPRSMQEWIGLPACTRCGHLHPPGDCAPSDRIAGPHRPELT